MAVFFKSAAPPGVVVPAGHLFEARRLRRQPALLRAWDRDADGRLSCRWSVPPTATAAPASLRKRLG